MEAQQVKEAFKASGIAVRIANQSLKFRVCTISSAPFDKQAARAIAASIGLTDASGLLGGQFNQSHELIGYKPGAVRRI